MAKEFAKDFYRSRRWQDCRRAYGQKRGWLCEECLGRNVLSYGEIVHHKIPLTAENIDDPEIAYGFNNLELVCRQCHDELHGKLRERKRYHFDENHEIVIEEPLEAVDEQSKIL